MDDTTTKSLEIHFHSATYQILMEAISGLRSVAGQLIKVWFVSVQHMNTDQYSNHFSLMIVSQKTMGSDRSVLQLLAEETVASFLSQVLEVDHLPHSPSVLQEIGIHRLVYILATNGYCSLLPAVSPVASLIYWNISNCRTCTKLLAG